MEEGLAIGFWHMLVGLGSTPSLSILLPTYLSSCPTPPTTHPYHQRIVTGLCGSSLGKYALAAILHAQTQGHFHYSSGISPGEMLILPAEQLVKIGPLLSCCSTHSLTPS